MQPAAQNLDVKPFGMQVFNPTPQLSLDIRKEREKLNLCRQKNFADKCRSPEHTVEWAAILSEMMRWMFESKPLNERPC